MKLGTLENASTSISFAQTKKIVLVLLPAASWKITEISCEMEVLSHGNNSKNILKKKKKKNVVPISTSVSCVL